MILGLFWVVFKRAAFAQMDEFKNLAQNFQVPGGVRSLGQFVYLFVVFLVQKMPSI